MSPQRPRVPVKRRKPRKKLRWADPVFVSKPEFARISGLGKNLVDQLVADGTLPTCVIAKRRWILREEAIALLRKQVA